MLLPFMLGNSDGLPSAVSSRSRALVCECSTSLNIECTVFLYMCCADFNAWNEQFGLLITWSESHKFVCCRLNSTMLVSLHSNELTAYAILIFACCYGCGCLRWCPAVLCCADSVCECNDSFVKWLWVKQINLAPVSSSSQGNQSWSKSVIKLDVDSLILFMFLLLYLQHSLGLVTQDDTRQSSSDFWVATCRFTLPRMYCLPPARWMSSRDC